jgi:hypothetical protein
MAKPRPLTEGMVAILKRIAAGEDPAGVWTTGRSHSGGLVTAMAALKRRGLIDSMAFDAKLTDAGRAVVYGVGLDGGPKNG